MFANCVCQPWDCAAERRKLVVSVSFLKRKVYSFCLRRTSKVLKKHKRKPNGIWNFRFVFDRLAGRWSNNRAKRRYSAIHKQISALSNVILSWHVYHWTIEGTAFVRRYFFRRASHFVHCKHPSVFRSFSLGNGIFGQSETSWSDELENDLENLTPFVCTWLWFVNGRKQWTWINEWQYLLTVSKHILQINCYNLNDNWNKRIGNIEISNWVLNENCEIVKRRKII